LNLKTNIKEELNCGLDYLCNLNEIPIHIDTGLVKEGPKICVNGK
jgi:hypothetical protein